MPDWNIKGKKYLVSGGGRGIGRAIAVLLGQNGAEVGVTYTGSSDRSERNARETCEQVESAGGTAKAYPMDLADENQINETAKKFLADFGSIDGLVNNGGVVIDQIAMRYKSEDWDRVLGVNLRGAFLLSKAFLRPLSKSDQGSIVNISSVVGQMGNAGQVAYVSSKAGLIGMTKSLALEMAPRQLRVNAVAPGFIGTDMTHGLTDEQREKILEKVPLRSLGSPEDIAWATLFLLSPVSGYITGQVLGVNGGMYM